MDNASKALIMSAGVMIAIGIISIALYIYTTAKNYARSSEDVMTVNQIAGFNRFYTAFEGTVKGVDAVNILNRALEDDIIAQESSASITKPGDTFVITDSVNYLNRGYTYSYTMDVMGKINSVTISGM